MFVTLAKKFVYGQVAIDCLAGPSEVWCWPTRVRRDVHSSDLLAQAEHDPATSILITWHEPLLDEVAAALRSQLATLPRATQARNSLESFGALVLARDADEAIAWTNQIGPEHLHIATADAEALVPRNRQRRGDIPGSLFAGGAGRLRGRAVARAADGATSRFASGLSANDFLRRSSVLSYTKAGLEALAPDVCRLAAEGGADGARGERGDSLRESPAAVANNGAETAAARLAVDR